MAPILKSTTGMIPQMMESEDLIELLNHLNALEPLSVMNGATTASSSTSNDSVGVSITQSEQPELLLLIRQLTDFLYPYKDNWSFEESVCGSLATAFVPWSH